MVRWRGGGDDGGGGIRDKGGSKGEGLLVCIKIRLIRAVGQLGTETFGGRRSVPFFLSLF